MAIMIPEKPIDIPIGSHEDEMFIALSNLPDEYYVFHSFVIINMDELLKYVLPSSSNSEDAAE